VRGPLAALRVVLLAASQPPRHETVCLLLDRGHRPLACIVVVGRGDIVAIGETMLLVAGPPPSRSTGALRHGGVGDVGAVVLATIRPGDGHHPGPQDELDWRRLRRRFAGTGVELVDWFLLDGNRAASSCELSDARSHRPDRSG
jgi:hypothetical protein